MGQFHTRFHEIKVDTKMSSLAGKVALVTGASSGIGAATAVHLSKLGAKLVIIGRNADRLEETFSKCEGSADTLIIKADIANEEDCKRIIETTSLEQYDRVMNVNVRAVFNLTMLAVPHLEKTKGNIVNVSSVNGIRSFPGVLAYNISKAALDQMTRCVALELAPKKIRVNSVNPGVIVTDIHKRGGMDDAGYAAFLEHSKTTHALGRVGDVFEVAKAIAFLASEDASFSTGVSLPVDGGRHAMYPR